MYISISIFAEPFLKIDEVNYDDTFPKITVKVNILSNDSMPVYGLTEENIMLYENGYRVNYLKIKNMLSSESDIIYLVFSVDSSKSISENFLKDVKKSISEIISISDTNEKIALMRFNDRVILLNNFSNNKKEILGNLDSIDRHGKNTMLYESIYDSIDLLKKTDAETKSIIIFSDGKDEGSSVNVDDIIQYARKQQVPVNFMCLKSSSNLKKMQRIAKLTGGEIIYGEDVSNVSVMYQKIIKELKSKYVIKYNSQLPKDGKDYNLEVKIKYGNLADSASTKIKTPSLEIYENIYFIFSAIAGFLFLIILILVTYILSCRKKKPEPKVDNFYNPMAHAGKNNYSEQPKDIYRQNEKQAEEETNYLSEYDSWLVVKDGEEKSKYPIHWNVMTVGKSDENTLIVQDEFVDDKHFKIKKVNSNYILMDMASAKGTYLNSKKLLRPKELYDWDEIKIGKTVFIFRSVNVK